MSRRLSKWKMSQSVILGKDKEKASYLKMEHIFLNMSKYQSFLLDYLYRMHIMFGFEDKFSIIKSRMTTVIEENIWSVFKKKQGGFFKILNREFNEILRNEERLKMDLDEKMQQAKSFYELQLFYNDFKSKILNIENSFKNFEVEIPRFIKYQYFKEVSTFFKLKN